MLEFKMLEVETGLNIADKSAIDKAEQLPAYNKSNVFYNVKRVGFFEPDTIVSSILDISTNPSPKLAYKTLLFGLNNRSFVYYSTDSIS